MTDLRIVDAPSLPTEEITDELKLPTGGKGNYAVEVGGISEHIVASKDLADKNFVNTSSNGVRQLIEDHLEDLDNPHSVTKEQVGLGNVDNTADLDKPVSNATQAAIITATNDKATVAQLNLKADKTYVDNQLSTKASNSRVDGIETELEDSKALVQYDGKYEFDAAYVSEIGGYPLNARLTLSNGDIVRSTVAGNTTDPNVDMTGWVIGIPASLVKDESGKTQQEINDMLLRDTYYALNEGFKTDGSDNVSAWNLLQAKLKAGDTVIFNAGTYTFSGNMDIEKIINIVGQGRIRGVKAILKFNSGGVVRKTAGIDIRDINIAGTQTSTILDFDNRVFGNIGLKEQYDGISDTSTCRLSSVTITGFDIGRVTAQEGTATWAGAYRDNTDVVIQRNRVGYVALDGATHEKYTGGTISANTEIGVWAEAKNHNYNNIDFIGTTLEINGHEGNEFNTRDVLRSLNVFAGANTIINFIGSYNERVVSIAKDGGIINKVGSYEHPNSYNFSSDGNINLVLSNSSHVSKLNMQNSLANLTANVTGGLSVVGVSDNHIRVTTSSQNLASFRSKEFKVTGVKNSEIRFIKLSFRYKFTSGFTANPQLNVQPLFFLRSTDGTTDTTTTNLAYPKQLLINSYNEWHTFEFFYRPRLVSGYLTPDDFLSSFDFRFIFYNGLSSTPNFTTDQLVCDIATVEVEIFANKQARLSLGYKNAGTTAERPTLLATEQGFQYYNTETNKLEFWNGMQWVVVSTTPAV